MELSVSKGEFLCLVGPTNAGKSTLLKTIAGLYRPEKGQVMINGRDVTNFEPGERHVSLLFQTVALFSNKSGYDNIAFPLQRAGLREEQVDRRVREARNCFVSITSSSTFLVLIPEGKDNESRSVERSLIHVSYCCWMSHCRIWTPGCDWNFGSSSVACTRPSVRL